MISFSVQTQRLLSHCNCDLNGIYKPEVIICVGWPMLQTLRFLSAKYWHLRILDYLTNTNLIRSLYNWRQCRELTKCTHGVTKKLRPLCLSTSSFSIRECCFTNSDQNQSKYSRIRTQHEKPPVFNYLKNYHTEKVSWMWMWPSFSLQSTLHYDKYIHRVTRVAASI